MLKVDDTGSYAEFCEAFKSFDREGQGYITAGEMNYMLTAMGMYKLRLYYSEINELYVNS